MKITRHANNAKDAQLTEARQAQVIEICRFYRMPPHKIAHLLQATFSNIEHQAIEFVTDTVMPWCTRWEQAVSRDLIVDTDTYVAEFLLMALLRGDVASRYAAYAVGRQWGWLSINDVRGFENMNPIEGGDEHLEPMNMVPLGTDRAALQSGAKPGGVPGRAPAETASAMRVLFVDAAARVAKAEARELEPRIAKQSEDPARFVAWARGFYETHAQYIAKTLMPLAAGFAGMTGVQVDAATLARAIVADAKAVVFDPEFAALADEFIATRAADVFARVRVAFSLEDAA
jgi:hypothetical protein